MHRNNILVCNSNKMHKSQSLFYLTAALHVSGVTIELISFSAKYTLFNNCNFNLVYRYSLSVNLTLSITVWRLPDAVVTVVCAPEDGW